MGIKLNLNTSPYYDDFAENKEFYKVLFRPGFSIQARELTTLQTILQNQVEKFGSHMFEEGAMVIPGESAIDMNYTSVKIQATYGVNTVEDYRTQYVGTVITGETSGVKAKVVNSVVATTTDSITLYVKYESSGTNNIHKVFENNENISSDAIISVYPADSVSAKTELISATSIGSSTSIAQGVYFTRGHFVKCNDESLILDKYTNTPSYRIGFDVTESLVTPEGDSSLLDNATGVSNFSAKGAHRLGINLTLAKRDITSVDDANFIEVIRVKNGNIQSKVQRTNYALLEDTLARRTYDESGDYTLEDFSMETREHLLDGDNLGIYPSGDSSKIALGVSQGKAYVKGFEVETLSTKYIEIDKARDINTINNAVVPAALGNYINVTNTWGTPDITMIGTTSTPFNEIKFYDEQNTVVGGINGNQIGQARCRAFEHKSGILHSTQGSTTNNEGVFSVYMFDIQMFITMDVSQSSTYGIGSKITGLTSGSYGYIHSQIGGAQYTIVQSSGSFVIGETLISSTATNTQNSTVIGTTVHDMSKVKQVFMDDPDAGHDFIADVVLDSNYTLAGSVQLNGSTTITGLNTFFSYDLRVGDKISIPIGSGSGNEERIVSSIVDDTSINVSVAVSGTLTGTIVRKRASMQEQEEVVSIYKLPKNNVKTLLTTTNNGTSDSTLSIRKQFQGIVSTNGNISFTIGSNEVFNNFSSTDYCFSILTAGTGVGAGTGVSGDIIDISSSISGVGTQTITISNSLILGTTGGTSVKLTATITRQIANHKTKTAHKSIKKIISQESSSNDIYGQRISDIDISLSVSDVYKIRGIYTSKDVSTIPVTPTITLTGISSTTFTAGEKIKGLITGATGGIINYTSATGILEYYAISGTFNSSEGITYNSSDTGTITLSNLGDLNVTSNYLMDTGQRDSFYDISKIVRKPSFITPIGQILVVFDYFSHSASGEFFSVDSYSGQIDYSDIPEYIATKVDPDTLAPSGQYKLRDCLDFRPRVSDGLNTDNNFVFNNRTFKNSGSSIFDIPKIDSLIRADFEFYLNRIDNLYMTIQGQFLIQKGISEELPVNPMNVDDAMKLAVIMVPAYTYNTKDIIIQKIDNSRYTMRDIGRLEKRISNLEYYTSLNMLEADTQSLQIHDANGFDRFKSGFIVDNFSGHSIGDVLHSDYNCAIDFKTGILRPRSYIDNIELKEWATTDTARSSQGYTKTGDILTLPYEHTVMVSQGFASRVTNVNPFAIQTWIGVLKITPSSDTWINTIKAPDIVIDVEGNYNTILAIEKDSLGTIWGSWTQNWTGVSTETSKVYRQGGARGVRELQDTIITTTVSESRSGVNTRLIESKERKLSGKYVIDSSIIPWIRHKHTEIEATGLKPNTRVYPFFDGVDVANTMFDKASPNTRVDLITDGAGKLSPVHFKIPGDKFRTGKKTLRLTDSSINDMTPGLVDTSAETTYEASGTLNTEQSTFLSVRNAEVIRTNTTEDATIVTSTRGLNVIRDWFDPLAQTFLVENKGGAFITKVDLFFQSKDKTLPVTVMVRTVENGFPAKTILPFSPVTLEPSDVNLSEDGKASTTFTFESPIYLKHMEEYCLVVQTASNDYKTWISQVGENDINSTRTISEQPYMGVLFKSQNSSTWTASQMEDLKFTLYKAKFDISVTANIKLVNEEVSIENELFSTHDLFTLVNNPISTESGVAKIRVYHENHGMHSTSSNVTISGVVAPTGESGTLASIPLSEINKDHTSISDIELDSYCVSTTQPANNSITGGGIVVTGTRDIPFNIIHPIVAYLDFPDVIISSNIQTTSGKSVAGSEIAYEKVSQAIAPSITLNEDLEFINPRIIASKKNETNNMNGVNSLDLNIQLKSINENISPIIDLERTSIITISNIVNKIDSAADIGTAHTYIPSTESTGDNNSAIYMTRKISLEVPATALRTMLAASVQSNSGIEVFYKTLRTDMNTSFDNIGWVPYNTSGEANIIPSFSKHQGDFKDYLYTIDNLPEFIAFSIKIVMKSSNSAQVPLIKNFRTISLAL